MYCYRIDGQTTKHGKNCITTNESSPIIFLGDFNLPGVNWATYSGSSPKSNKFCDLLFQLNLFQLVDEPTYNQGNTLDLIITNNEDIVYNISIHPHYQPISSDHFIVTLSVKLHADHIPSHTPLVIFDYSKANYLGLINYLSHIDYTTCEQLSDIDSIWLFIKNNITRGMDLFIPKIRTSSSQFPKWYTSNIRHQIKCLQTLSKKYKSHPIDHNLNRIKTAEDNLQNSIQQAKANFEANLVHNFAFSNDSKIYQHVRNITTSASIPATVFFDDSSATHDIDKVSLFNRYFYFVFSQSTYSLPLFEDMPSTYSTIDSINITEDKVHTALVSLDSSKVIGIDGINPAVLKKLCYCFNQTFYTIYFHMPFTIVVFLLNGRYIASPLFSKLATKIVLLIIDLYPYSALCPRYWNILFMKKLQNLFLAVSLSHNLDS